jgi:hypothetical protein
MAHSRGFDLARFTDDSRSRFGRQFSSLARDGGHLSEALARYATDVRHDAGHLAHDLADQALHQGAVAARVLGKQAWRAGKAVRRDPAPTMAALVGIACLVTLVMASNARRR